MVLDKNILTEAICFYGRDKQIDMAVEEMAELIKAICKYKRYHTIESMENIVEECADVIITLAQIRLMFGDENIDKVITEKMCRLHERIKEDEDRTR